MSRTSAKKVLLAGGARAGQAAFTTAGSFLWTVPAGVKEVCVVCVAPGGGTFLIAGEGRHSGGGGGLRWRNRIPVTPGTQISVVVGAASINADGGTTSFGNFVFASGGKRSVGGGDGGQGSPIGGDIGGGNGGRGSSYGTYNGGGGGAGGYSGNGGNGSSEIGSSGAGGGGGGGGSNGGGGGVGLKGQGASGAGGLSSSQDFLSTMGRGGSSGADGGFSGDGGAFGGGAGGNNEGGVVGKGGLRIIWGKGRAFPATKTGDF